MKLGVNYRSTPEVIAVADRLIKCSMDRIAVEFSTNNASGEPVKLAAFARPEDEADVIAMNVEQQWRQAMVPPREMAVFYRTNDMSRLVEQALTKRQIPYKVVGSGSYYDRMEIKDVLSMLRFLCNPHDGISFARVANKPARGMGDALVGRVEAHAERHGMDIVSALAKSEDVRDEQDRPLSDAARKACDDVLNLFLLRRERHERPRRRPGGAGADRVRQVAEGEVRAEERVRVPPAERDRADQQHRRVLRGQPQGLDRRLPAEHQPVHRRRWRAGRQRGAAHVACTRARGWSSTWFT